LPDQVLYVRVSFHDQEITMVLTEKQQCYQEHLRAAEQSGQPLAVYARERDVNVQALYGERQRMRRSGSKPTRFLKVQDVAPSPVMPMSLLQVRLPNGVSLGIPTDQMSLGDLIQTLAKL